MKTILGVLLAVFIGTAALSVSAQSGDVLDHSVHAENERYVCPMHSHIVKDHPGTCPICGMDLVLRKQKPTESLDVSVSGGMQQAMALTTETADISKLWRFIYTYGSVQFDETSLQHIHPRASGWIEKLTVNSLGQQVRKGELLYELYAPDLLVAQEDFLLLLSSQAKNKPLLERSKRRLSLLGIDQKLIEQLEQTRQVRYQVPYYAEQDGIVSALDVREGMYIEPGVSIMTVADLSKVWVIADVFEHQMDWVKTGKAIEIDIPALDLYKLEGSVEFIYPTLDPVTRTLQVRLVLDNPDQQLKPDMLATVRIYAGPKETLNIPVDALIQTEKHNRVFVQVDDGTFQRRDVEVGIVTHGRAEILAGLEVGERVVTAGQFLLDAEANLNNVATRNSTPASQHQH
ncbi:efflux RND transporter periplasmic adaptor subunit [Alteromonas flava]|uniref:efflux RND transporter periplasmic adaptor subunit n=1 Tax=Alteromonas flava TaxID=2048003 RepID=UPI0013DA02C8|nr:efflux RND transporter periplasmic adaptor subunit [Alteromonas flava]